MAPSQMARARARPILGPGRTAHWCCAGWTDGRRIAARGAEEGCCSAGGARGGAARSASTAQFDGREGYEGQCRTGAGIHGSGSLRAGFQVAGKLLVTELSAQTRRAPHRPSVGHGCWARVLDAAGRRRAERGRRRRPWPPVARLPSALDAEGPPALHVTRPSCRGTSIA